MSRSSLQWRVPPPATLAEEARAPARFTCLSAADTREAVKARKLLEPFGAIKFASSQKKAEALSAKLCHIGDEFFYEITLLHHDGRLMRVQVQANGTKPAFRTPRESHEAGAKDRVPTKDRPPEKAEGKDRLPGDDHPLKKE